MDKYVFGMHIHDKFCVSNLLYIQYNEKKTTIDNDENKYKSYIIILFEYIVFHSENFTFINLFK